MKVTVDFDPEEYDGTANQPTRRALRRFKEKYDLRDKFVCDGPAWERLIEFPYD